MKNEISKPWVIISVHKTVRELESKLLLTSFLIEKGFNVIIGRTGYLRDNFSFLPRGIYFDLRFLKTRKKVFKKAVKYGHKVVTIDEEAVSAPNLKFYLKQVDNETLNLTERIFCWGKVHSNIINSVVSKKNKKKIIESGHPRFDILRPEFDNFFIRKSIKLKNKYGDFILINSSTGGWVMKSEVEKQYKGYTSRNIISNSENEKNNFFNDFRYRKKKHKKLVELIEALALKFPQKKIIIRPHFTESIKDWKSSLSKVLANNTNIKIIKSGSVNYWIKASKLMIHTGCTTGTESFVGKNHVIIYEPNEIINHDTTPKISSKLSIYASSINEVLSISYNIFNNKYFESKSKRIEKEKLFDTNFSSRTGKFSSEIISEELAKIAFTDKANFDLEKKSKSFKYLSFFTKKNILMRYLYSRLVPSLEETIYKKKVKSIIKDFFKIQQKKHVILDFSIISHELFMIKKRS